MQVKPDTINGSWRGAFLEGAKRTPATSHLRGHPATSTVEDFGCDLTLLRELSSPTMSFPTTPRKAGSSPNCKDNIPRFSSSAAEVTVSRTAGRWYFKFDGMLTNGGAVERQQQSVSTQPLTSELKG
jgi:hypothetical protein